MTTALVICLLAAASPSPVAVAVAVDRKDEAKSAPKQVDVRMGDHVEVTIARSPRVLIPAGRFRMGATREQMRRAEALCGREVQRAGALMAQIPSVCRSRVDVEGPVVDVDLSSFAIDRDEVTVGQYLRCVEQGRCAPLPGWVLDWSRARTGGSVTDDEATRMSALPVEGVTFWEANRYCRAQGGRLPTEAEWEHAARGLGDRLFPWGSFFRDGRCNHGGLDFRPTSPIAGEGPDGGGAGDAMDGHLRSAPVGSFPDGESPYGVRDMSGNVWEWTQGIFSRQPPQILDSVDPEGTTFGSERTVRGGGYLAPRSAMRVTGRWGLAPGARVRSVGFRCAYDLAP